MHPNLSRLQACDQGWDEMPPSAQGRRCGMCQKQVVDFRGKSPLEIGLVHASSEQPVCGRYSSVQLGGSGGAVTAFPLRPIISLAAGLSVLSSTAASAENVAPKVEQAPAPPYSADVRLSRAAAAGVPGAAAAAADTLIIRGTVLDSATAQPLAGAMVLVQGTQIGTVTDSRGQYTLALPNSGRPDPLVLVAMLIGYSRAERVIAPDVDGTAALDFVLPPSQVELTAFYVAAVSPKPSLWQRIRRLFGDGSSPRP